MPASPKFRAKASSFILKELCTLTHCISTGVIVHLLLCLFDYSLFLPPHSKFSKNKNPSLVLLTMVYSADIQVPNIYYNGNSFQYSCLENPMGGGAWWAAVHEVPGSRHDWVTSLSLFTFMHWRRKWQPTPVFLPGESQGQGSLVGCRPWGHTESDTTGAT